MISRVDLDRIAYAKIMFPPLCLWFSAPLVSCGSPVTSCDVITPPSPSPRFALSCHLDRWCWTKECVSTVMAEEAE